MKNRFPGGAKIDQRLYMYVYDRLSYPTPAVSPEDHTLIIFPLSFIRLERKTIVIPISEVYRILCFEWQRVRVRAP